MFFSLKRLSCLHLKVLQRIWARLSPIRVLCLKRITIFEQLMPYFKHADSVNFIEVKSVIFFCKEKKKNERFQFT